jgi:hypothetical protein
MAFDPKRHVIKVQGRQYLPVSARLIWFREEHPDWGIVTEIIEINSEEKFAIFRATIFNEEGRLISSATKKEDIKGFGDYIEKAECVPLSTQILTAEGWKTHDQLRIGESVLAYDAETDALRWAPLLAVRTYEQAPVVRLRNNKGFNVLCTPDHKWHIRYDVTNKGKKYHYQQMRETQELPTSARLTVAASGPQASPSERFLSVTPEQAFVMGMLITDGHMKYYDKHMRGYICQSKPEGVAIIRERLAQVPHREDIVPAHTRTFPTGKTYDCLQGYRWHPTSPYLHELHAAFNITNETQLPHVIAFLTPEARKSLMEAMTLAEADKRGNFAQMPGRNDWVIDLWTALCALEGSMVCQSVVRPTCGGIWTARRKKTRFVYASNLVQEDAGRLDVWCPQTPYGTWVARFDNDVVTITGNTGSVGRALAMCGYGAQFEPDLADGGGSAPRREFNGPPREFNNAPARPAPPREPMREPVREQMREPMGERPMQQRPAPPMEGRPAAAPPMQQRPAPAPVQERPAPVQQARPAPPASSLDDDDFPPPPDDPMNIPGIRRGNEIPRPAPRPVAPAPNNSAAPPPVAARPAPAGAPVQRVREAEQSFIETGADDDDDFDPFLDEAPPAPPARPAAAKPTAPAPARKPTSDSLL